MDKHKVIDILTRYRAKRCTEEERHLVENWIIHGAADPLDLSDNELLEDLLAIRLRLEYDLRKEASKRVFGLRKWFLYVAAMLVMGAIGTWALWTIQIIDQKTEIISLKAEDILPGGNRATLIFDNGHTIDLSVAQREIIVGDEITYADGSAVLNPGSGAGNSHIDISKDHLSTSGVQLLTLSTPKGGTYQVTLPDGSKVWLNAASKLRYPSRFAKKERIVELEGEAYFDVARTLKTIRPFLVKSRNQTVEVLGTRFNISAYNDESEVKTTLVEGSVKVALINKASTSPAILKPGQQSIVGKERTTVNDVDVSSFVGWKEGYFIFNGTELREAMKQLSRWYDLEVAYEGIIPSTPFYGKISRHDTLAEVLVILKEGKVKFRIEKHGATNRLIVMQ